MVAVIRVKQTIILLVAAATCYILYTSFSLSVGDSKRQVEKFGEVQINVAGKDDGSRRDAKKTKFFADDQLCKIPKLDINNEEVIPFFKAAKPLGCERKNRPNWLFVNDKGLLELTPSRKGAECKVRYVIRKDDNQNLAKVEEPVKEGDRLKHDFARVVCTQDSTQWTGLLMTVSEAPEIRRRAQEKKKPEETLNVYFMGFDSLSQMSFRRNLPKTVEYLEKVMEAVILDGYNIVGDGTPQAFIPILTGQTEEELPLTRKRYKEANYVDDVYPFVWSNFSDAGYATLYAEDAFGIGTFTYRLKGFRKQPTDHFTRTLFKETEKKPMHQWNCLGSEPLHKSWLRYSREFMRVYAGIPRFLLMHQSLLSHDDINQIKVEDDDLFKHLKSMFEAGEFENTLVIVMADHGHRFAQLRSTHQGQLEERMPFFSFSLPKKFRETENGEKIFSNLKTNKGRLSTPFDVHATLLDVLHPPSLDELNTVQTVSKRSLSLFRPLPDNRTCAQADVAPHWCTCLNWKDAMKTEEDKKTSIRLANIVVDTMNEQMKEVTDLCVKLKLKELLEAKKLIPNEGLLKYKSVKDADGFVPDLSGTTSVSFAHFQLKLSTTPGKAIYEITLSYDFRKNVADIDLTSISHVNKYGNDPHCIIDKNYYLATYCVCHDRV